MRVSGENEYKRNKKNVQQDVLEAKLTDYITKHLLASSSLTGRAAGLSASAIS